MTDEQPSYEELAAPRPNRFGQVLAVLLTLLVGVVVIIRVANSGSSSDHAVPTTSVPPTVHSAPVTPPPIHTVVVPRFHPVPPCPRATDGQAACTTYPGLAASTELALRERFPRIVVESAVTQMLRPSGPEVRPGMWSRAIRGHVGALKLRIAVRRAEPLDGRTTGLRRGNRLELIRYIRDHYLVQFELRGPVDHDSLSTTIAWLLTEPRLVRPALARGGTMAG